MEHRLRRRSSFRPTGRHAVRMVSNLLAASVPKRKAAFRAYFAVVQACALFVPQAEVAEAGGIRGNNRSNCRTIRFFAVIVRYSCLPRTQMLSRSIDAEGRFHARAVQPFCSFLFLQSIPKPKTRIPLFLSCRKQAERGWRQRFGWSPILSVRIQKNGAERCGAFL